MRSLVLATGIMATIISLSVAQADQSDAAPVSTKRQIIICMTKSMSANKTLSYNDAQKDCKERVIAHAQNAMGKSALAANAAAAPALKTP